MIRGLFVTGTDTGVGKTVVAAALMQRYREELELRYWKPIQTGIEKDDDTRVVRQLGGCQDAEIFAEGVRLKRAVSPHLAAHLSGRRIELTGVCQMISSQPQGNRSWIIEGAGGALVPVNTREQMVDLPRLLALPVLVVARTRLGTINHTLLTIEALRRRALIIAGVVMVGEKDKHNTAAIESHGLVSVLGEMPQFKTLTAQSLKDWARAELDPRNLLLDHLRLGHAQRVDLRFD